VTPAETTAYVAHHLNLARRADTLFSDDATAALIQQVSRGPPRAINNLALRALVAADPAKGPSSMSPRRALLSPKPTPD
jgi:type II secretory pathway predicted ATPase ExeA